MDKYLISDSKFKSLEALKRDVNKIMDRDQRDHDVMPFGFEHADALSDFAKTTMAMYFESLTQKLGVACRVGVSPRNIIAANSLANTRRGVFAIHKGWQHIFQLNTDQYRLEFMEGSNGEIEIWWIQMNQTTKGLGTEVMNHILDAADEQGVTIKAIPVPVDCRGGKYTYERLSAWYQSFGFEYGPSPIDPAVYYKG